MEEREVDGRLRVDRRMEVEENGGEGRKRRKEEREWSEKEMEVKGRERR